MTHYTIQGGGPVFRLHPEDRTEVWCKHTQRWVPAMLRREDFEAVKPRANPYVKCENPETTKP